MPSFWLLKLWNTSPSKKGLFFIISLWFCFPAFQAQIAAGCSKLYIMVIIASLLIGKLNWLKLGRQWKSEKAEKLENLEKWEIIQVCCDFFMWLIFCWKLAKQTLGPGYLENSWTWGSNWNYRDFVLGKLGGFQRSLSQVKMLKRNSIYF